MLEGSVFFLAKHAQKRFDHFQMELLIWWIWCCSISNLYWNSMIFVSAVTVNDKCFSPIPFQCSRKLFMLLLRLLFFSFQCLGWKFVHVNPDMSYGHHVLLLHEQTFAWHYFSFPVWCHLLCSSVWPDSNGLLGSICFTECCLSSDK